MNPTTSIGPTVNEGSTVRGIVWCTQTGDRVKDESKEPVFFKVHLVSKVGQNSFRQTLSNVGREAASKTQAFFSNISQRR
jgi:hypothetical protein